MNTDNIKMSLKKEENNNIFMSKICYIVSIMSIVITLIIFIYATIRLNNAYYLTPQEQSAWSHSAEPIAPYVKKRISDAINIYYYALGSSISALIFLLISKITKLKG